MNLWISAVFGLAELPSTSRSAARRSSLPAESGYSLESAGVRHAIRDRDSGGGCGRSHPFRSSKLANSGETLTLRTADGEVVFSITTLIYLPMAGGPSLELSGHSPPTGLSSLRITRKAGCSGGRRRSGYATPADIRRVAEGLLHRGSTQLPPSVPGSPPIPYRDDLRNLRTYACGTHPRVPTGEPDHRRLGDLRGGEIECALVSLQFPGQRLASEARFEVQLKRGLGPWRSVISAIPGMKPPGSIQGVPKLSEAVRHPGTTGFTRFCTGLKSFTSRRSAVAADPVRLLIRHR